MTGQCITYMRFIDQPKQGMCTGLDRRYKKGFIVYLVILSVIRRTHIDLYRSQTSVMYDRNIDAPRGLLCLIQRVGGKC